MKTISILMLAFGAIGFCSADTVLYAPARSIADQQITVHSWGGGTIAETDEVAFEGASSIRVSARNLFSGGKIEFGASPDLSKEFADKNTLLRIMFKPADMQTTLSGPGGKGPGGKGPGGSPGLQTGGNGAAKGGPPAGGPPPGKQGGGGGSIGLGGGGGAGGQIGLGGGGLGGGSTAAPKAELQTLRMVVTTTDGLRSEAYLPAGMLGDERGWRVIGLPLQAISGFSRTNKIVKEISFGTDKTTTIWIGDLRTFVDATPITGETFQHDLNLAQGDEIVLSASGNGGASMLKYEWYFDKDTNGAPDAVGQAIKHKFRKPDTYTITLIISDYFGLKQPYKTTITAKVN